MEWIFINGSHIRAHQHSASIAKFACTDFCSKLKLNVIELQDIEIFEPLSDTFLINLKIFLILVGYIHLLKHGFLGALRPVHSSNH